MATTLDTQGNQIVNGFSTNLPPASTISADKLNPTTPIQITAPQTPDYASILNSNVAELGQQAQNAQIQYEQQLNEAKNLASNKSSLEALLGGKAAETATSYETGGVNKAAEQLRQLNAQAVGLQNEAQAIPIQIQQGATGQGVTDRGVAPIQTARLRENALKALSLGQQAAIAQADYATAKDKADQLINMKYAGIESDIKAKQTQLDALEKYTLTPAQQKAAQVQKQLLEAQATQTENKKATEKSIQDIGLTLRKYGVDNSVVSDVLNSSSINDAMIKAGNNLRDPKAQLELASLRADIAYKNAQTAKLNKETQLSGEPTPTQKKELAQSIANKQASAQAASDKISAVDNALTYSSGIASRVGPNMFSRGVFPVAATPVVGPALAAQGIKSAITGEGQKLAGTVHQLTAGLTLATLIDAKANGATFGALSDGERSMIASAATKLNDWEVKDDKGNPTGYWNIDENSFKQELKTIQDLSRKALLKSQGTVIAPDEQAQLDASFPEQQPTANQYYK